MKVEPPDLSFGSDPNRVGGTMAPTNGYGSMGYPSEYQQLDPAMHDLCEQAALRGIETEYIDASGQRRVVDPGTIARLIEAIPHDDKAQRRIFAPTIVVPCGRACRVGPST